MSSPNPFDANASAYDAWYDQNPVLYELELSAIGELLPPPDQGRRLEIGVGSGRFAGPLGFTDGIDPGQNLLQMAASAGLTVRQGVAEQLPYADDSFTVVGIFTALEFFSDPAAALAQVRRVLTSDGVLVLAWLNRASTVGQQLADTRAEDLYYAGANFYSPDEIVDLLAANGFQEVDSRQIQVGEGVQPVIEAGNTDGLYCVLRAAPR